MTRKIPSVIDSVPDPFKKRNVVELVRSPWISKPLIRIWPPGLVLAWIKALVTVVFTVPGPTEEERTPGAPLLPSNVIFWRWSACSRSN